ncbi:MAG: hypothetical protein MH472_03600 [Bacteroidia bacterium]|nr:hypothetical protein [Bacteroidia bacterium]
MDVFCVGLVFSRADSRYQGYARQYVEALLRLQKHVAIFSPHWIELNQYFQIHFRDQANRIHCFAITETLHTGDSMGKWAFFWRYVYLRRTLKNAERRMNMAIDFVFFAPVDDWIRPKFPKYWLNRLLKYQWSGLLLKMEDYGDLKDLEAASHLPLNVDPSFKDPDYLLSSPNCVAVCTLDRFRSEQLKSRVYKKVIVLPDISDYKVPEMKLKMADSIKKMSRGRMIVGAVLAPDDDPESFIKLLLNANSEHYFFVCAGAFSPQQLSPSSYQALTEVLSSTHDNHYFILHEMEEYEHLNALIQLFDVCYIPEGGNKDLPHITLSKAAYFKKPVIAPATHMNGALTESLKLGITYEENTEALLQSLHTLYLQMPLELNYDHKPLNNYAQLQNQSHLREAWEMLLWM